MIVVPDISKTLLLDRLITALGAFRYHLYNNDVTPDDSSTIGTFTEADYDGYAYQTVTLGGSSIVSHRGTAVGTPLTFTKSGSVTPNQIYGYYVTDTSNTFLFAERGAAAPYDFSVDGASLTITPKLQDASI